MPDTAAFFVSDICIVMKIRGLFSAIAAIILLASCEKEDVPVTLPPPNDAVYTTVEMGENYTDQLFYDFATEQVVQVSQVNSWDLAFDASQTGHAIFLNGGTDVLVYATGKSDIHANVTPPGFFSKDWQVDDPSGLADGTAIGRWADEIGVSKGEVFIIKLNEANNPDNLHKIKLIAHTAEAYTMQYASLKDEEVHTITIPKSDDYNYSYFSFNNGGSITHPEPPKHTWDIVFTRYKHIYRDLDDFPYIVSGVLMNPYKTSGIEDSTKGFENMEGDWILSQSFRNDRDVIGFDWKTYDVDKAVYTVNPMKCYVIKNRNNEYWRLHFLKFYNEQGVKGSPSFEFQRVY